MAKYGIDTAAMLVEFRASVWTARKLDKTTTDEVVTSKNAAAKDAARVNKHLLAGRNELENITKHVGAVRNYVYGMTMPWSDSGIRLLPAISFMGFNERIKDETDAFWKLVTDFKAIYPTLITAQAMALGNMFKREDFPSVSELDHKFDMGVNYMPVPTSGDWRVDVGNDAQRELVDQMQKIGDQRVKAALQDVRNRMYQHLVRMSDRLVVDQVDGENKGRKFHDTLVDTGYDLCEMVKSLNITGDPDIEAIRKRMEQALGGVTAKELRENFTVRAEVKKDVDDILSKFTW